MKKLLLYLFVGFLCLGTIASAAFGIVWVFFWLNVWGRVGMVVGSLSLLFGYVVVSSYEEDARKARAHNPIMTHEFEY